MASSSALARTIERGGQHGELGVAADDERIDVRALRGSSRGDLVAKLGHEPIPATGHRLDDPVAEHLTKLVHVAPHRALADHGAAPHLREQLLVRDELLRMCDQVAQDRERLPAQDEQPFGHLSSADGSPREDVEGRWCS